MREPTHPPVVPRLLRPVALLAGLVVGAVAAGCGGASRAGAPQAEPPQAEARRPAADSAVPHVDLEPASPPERESAWLPFGVQWEPRAPREGEAVALHLLRPRDGLRPRRVTGRLGEAPVHFAETEDGWFGVAPAGIGSAGQAELVLRFHGVDGRTVEQRSSLTIREYDFPATQLSVAPRYSSPSREALARIRAERKLIRATLSQVSPRWLPRRGFTWPRQTRITSPFGQRRVFNEELKSRHTGVDLAGETGDRVGAAGRGRVALTGDFYFSGKAVFLDHGLGVFTAYFHLSEIEVEEGELVSRGTTLGRVGATGRVTGPHLHWALFVSGKSLDARSLLSFRIPRLRAGSALSAGGPDPNVR